MKKIAVAGISAAALAVGSVAVAAAMPIGAALAEDGAATTTVQPEGAAGTTGPEATSPAEPDARRSNKAGLESLLGHFEDAGLAPVLDSLVQDGTITEEQSAAITERFASKADEARTKFEAEHPRLAQARERLDEASQRWAERGDQFRATLGAEVDELSSFLGISSADLKTRLATESLAEIAGDKAPELVSMLAAKANARIDEAVASGKFDEQRAAEVKARTAEQIEKALDFIGGNNLQEQLRGFFEGRGGR